MPSSLRVTWGISSSRIPGPTTRASGLATNTCFENEAAERNQRPAYLGLSEPMLLQWEICFGACCKAKRKDGLVIYLRKTKKKRTDWIRNPGFLLLTPAMVNVSFRLHAAFHWWPWWWPSQQGHHSGFYWSNQKFLALFSSPSSV